MNQNEVDMLMLEALKSTFAALDALLDDRPQLRAKLAGYTTLGNLRAHVKSVIASATAAQACSGAEND